jgi:hypothetical protein
LSAQIPLDRGPLGTETSSDVSALSTPPILPAFLDTPIRSSKKLPPMPSKIKVVEKPQMLEINPGIWDGLSPEQAKKYYSQDWDRFTKDPYSFRAPRAESYHDLSGTPLFLG